MLIGKPIPQGWASLTDRATGKVLKEANTYTCVRCNAVIHVPPGRRFEDVANIDPNTMGVMCARHAGDNDRRSYLQKEEANEDRDARLNVLRKLGL